MSARLIRIFVLAAGGLLLAGALNRFIIAAGSGQFFALSDPALGIPLRYAVLAVGAIELVVALICLFGRRVEHQIGWLTWLGTSYVVFWIGLVLQHCPPQGSCIGSLTDPLRIYYGTTGYILELLPFPLVLCSYAAMVWLWSQRRSSQPIETEKMACHSCGVHIEFAVQYLGQRIPCPQCQATITLRRPENLKMSCSFCKEHIEFPSHALGQKIPCPHCKMGIILLEPA